MFNELKDVVGRKYKKKEIENSTRMFDYLGKIFSASDYTWARYTTQKIARSVMEQTDKYDVMIMPIISQPPANITDIRPKKSAELINEVIMSLRLGGLFNIQSFRETVLNGLAPQSLWYAPDAMLQNATGQPAISLPTYWTDNNLPLGVQFVGRYADETTLLSLGSQLEESAPWIQRIPDII